jgi:hypothetical protein
LNGLRGFRLLVGRGRKPTPARCGRDRSLIWLVGTDGQAIHQRIVAQVQLAGVAVIDLSGIWPLVGVIVDDGRATRRTPPRHARTLDRGPSARCSELHSLLRTCRRRGSHCARRATPHLDPRSGLSVAWSRLAARTAMIAISKAIAAATTQRMTALGCRHYRSEEGAQRFRA